jgi:hypothetical protein
MVKVRGIMTVPLKQQHESTASAGHQQRNFTAPLGEQTMNRESCNPVINRRAVFTLETLRPLLGLSKACLPREIRLGRLRVARRAGRYFILGAWVLEWLEAGEVRKRRNLDDLIDCDQSSQGDRSGARNVRVAVEPRLD